MKQAVFLRWRRDCRKIRQCTWAERRLLAQACLFLLLARAAVRWLPFRRTLRLFGLRPLSPPERAHCPALLAAAGRGRATAPAAATAWAVRAAATRVPGGGNCLAQALGGAAILRRRGIGATIQLGVAVTGPGREGMTAHAWLRCGATAVTGEAGAPGFVPVAAVGCHSDGQEGPLTVRISVTSTALAAVAEMSRRRRNGAT